jgi:cytochrome b subunit of formate dehydrogenase/nitrate/TMAO reductase-like tetraheme cytochrome c subunit
MRNATRNVLFAAVLALFAAGASAQLTNDDCLGCHGDPSAAPVYVDAAKFQASVHASLNCNDCHLLIADVPHENVGKVDCAGCHADQVAQYATSVHGKARAKGDTVAATCVDCHGKHDILPKSDPKSKTNRFHVPQTCASCHENVKMTKSHPVPPPQVIQKYFEGVHGKGTLEKGLNVSAICSDCHGAHAVLPKSDPNSTISHMNVPKTCGKCHEGILGQFVQSAHGQLWEKNNTKGPVCISCHESHGIRRVETPDFRLGVVTECSNCHAHEAPTYRDSFHGQSTELGFSASAKCSDCHTPHLNLPKSDPRSSVNPKNLVATCRKCHPNAGANYATFQPHADPHDKAKSPQVYYVYNYMMKWLLFGVFIFFGIHTLLWLQRSIVALARGEFPKAESPSGRWILRFQKKHRLTHIAIVVSFLALAATGLPLMYSHHPWGRALARAFGGVGVSTNVHRVFAVVTFGYALFHLGFLLRAFFIKKDRSIFWGPNSMVPRVRDVVDLKNMVKWFLYIGKRPRFDRFTYWEKFDYFAVFWGVPVIGLSGLMLWIPSVVTRILPGWMLNVAMLIHGDEALLAIGFIFTFHFFHTHLRPEAFPLDPVMFTGVMPIERFKDERPDEYERLAAAGRLEEILVGPPTEEQLTFTRWFGFIALAIGVVLIIAIYATLLSQFSH